MTSTEIIAVAAAFLIGFGLGYGSDKDEGAVSALGNGLAIGALFAGVTLAWQVIT